MHADFLLFDGVARAQCGGAPSRVNPRDNKKRKKGKTRLDKKEQSALIVTGEGRGSKSKSGSDEAAIWKDQPDRRPGTPAKPAFQSLRAASRFLTSFPA